MLSRVSVWAGMRVSLWLTRNTHASALLTMLQPEKGRSAFPDSAVAQNILF